MWSPDLHEEIESLFASLAVPVVSGLRVVRLERRDDKAEYYKANRERILAQQREYRRRNRERVAWLQKCRRAA